MPTSFTPGVDALTNGQTNWGPTVKADIDALNVQVGLAAINTYRVGSASALSALTGIRAGDYAVRTDLGATYRYNGSIWAIWEWPAVPINTYVVVASGFSIPQAELDIGGGIAALSFTVTNSNGLGADTSYFTLKSGFRPSGIIHFGGLTSNASSVRVPAALRVETDGSTYLSSNGGVSATSMSGSVSFRPAN